MKMKMKVLAAAISAIGAVGAVQASTQGQAILNVTNVLFYDNGTNTILDASDFVQLPATGGLFITDSANLSPSVNGVPNPAFPFTVGGTGLPLTVQCVAAACPGMNSGAPFVPAVSPPTNDGAMAAVQLSGNPITGLIDPSNGGADALASSLAQMTGNGTANTTSSLTLAAVFRFTPNNDTTVRFEFDAYKYLLAYTDTPVNAFGGVAWNISIQDTATGLEIFDWSPNGLVGGITGGVEVADPCSLNDSVTAFFPASISPGETCNTEAAPNNGALFSYSALSPLLVAGTTYNLSINHQTQAVVINQTPEPSSLLLAGLALAGVGFSIRRKARSGN